MKHGVSGKTLGGGVFCHYNIQMIQNSASIILAAGKGTRMKSSLPKVLHQIAGQPMIHHVTTACQDAGIADMHIIIGPDMDSLASAVTPHKTHTQKEQLGTGDAVKAAKDALHNFEGYIFILYGDVPFIHPETLENLYNAATKTGMAILGFEAANPHGYGRLITSGTTVTEIVEEKDCTDAQRLVTLCNAGGYCVDGRRLFAWLDQLSDDNAQKEYYLTDIVSIAAKEGVKCAYAIAEEAEVMGINSRAQLAIAEKTLQSKLRTQAMANGVTMIDPDTVYLSTDTAFGQDVIIEPNVFFGTGVRIGSNTHIHAFSHIEGAEIGDHSSVGPFARIRPQSKIGNHATVGNFIEVNRSEFKDGSKSKHLSYIGDAVIGEKANIGAGTVIANYDGFNKNDTTVGVGAFIGSNSTLIAPLTIGDGAIIAGGSVITQNVATDAMAIARPDTTIKPGAAAEYRQKKGKKK